MSTRTQMFISKISGGALKLWDKFGILPSVAIGQAILESAWGQSSLAIKYNNLFGIKGSYKGESAMLNTWEVYGGKRYDIKDGFRVYPDWETSILDYGVFLTVNKRYAQALKVQDYKTQIKRIHNSGYATDPDYAKKVISIIEKYKLVGYDKQVLTSPPPKPSSPPPPSEPTKRYTVRTGDTLSHIAQKFETTVNKLMELNPKIKNKNVIYSGQALQVPDQEKVYYVVKFGDTLSEIAQEHKTTVEALVKLNKFANPNLIYQGSRIRVR